MDGKVQKRIQNLKIPSSHLKYRTFGDGLMKDPSFLKRGEIRKTPIPPGLLCIDHVDEHVTAGSSDFISDCNTKEYSSVIACGIFSLV